MFGILIGSTLYWKHESQTLNIMELPDHVLPDLINLTKVGVVATDEISTILLRSLVWGSEQINDFERHD